MQAQAEEQRKNREAESAWARKNVWDSNEASEDGDMGTSNFLGDINQTPVVIPQSGGDFASKALMAILAATGGAGLASYFMKSEVQPPAVQQSDDETVKIGLGKIEDYINE